MKKTTISSIFIKRFMLNFGINWLWTGRCIYFDHWTVIGGPSMTGAGSEFLVRWVSEGRTFVVFSILRPFEESFDPKDIELPIFYWIVFYRLEPFLAYFSSSEIYFSQHLQNWKHSMKYLFKKTITIDRRSPKPTPTPRAPQIYFEIWNDSLEVLP